MRLASTRFPSSTKPSLPRCSVLEKKAFDFAWTTAGEIAAAFAAGRVTALNVVELAFTRIRARDPLINSFTALTEERARLRAQALDDARARGEPAPPLAGVPFAVKNLFDIAGLPTLAGSKINRDAPPAGRDAALIERLEAAGAILVGGLNMGEYAYDFTGENVHDGPARNPHDLTRMTGGSSSGSAAAVAGGLVPLARLRHQRLDPRAVFALRPVRTEADLWTIEPRAHVSLRCKLRSCRAAGAQRSRPRDRL